MGVRCLGVLQALDSQATNIFKFFANLEFGVTKVVQLPPHTWTTLSELKLLELIL